MNKRVKTQSISSSGRWLQCTASLLHNNKPFEENEYSLTGTMIHDLTAKKLREHFFKENNSEYIKKIKREKYFSRDGSFYVEWKNQYNAIAENYIKYIKAIERQYGEGHLNARILIEHKLSLNFYEEKKIGYADFVMITHDALIIVDLKTGRTKVSAEENSQMLMYAIGIMQEFGVRPKIITAISQPVIYNVIAYQYTPQELLSWYQRQAQPMNEIITGELVYRPSVDACRYCDYRNKCAERIKKAVF